MTKELLQTDQQIGCFIRILIGKKTKPTAQLSGFGAGAGATRATFARFFLAASAGEIVASENDVISAPAATATIIFRNSMRSPPC